MKRSFALAVMAFASQAAAVFAGEPMVSSKQVIEPSRNLFPTLRGNEFVLGAFATYVTWTNGGVFSGAGDNTINTGNSTVNQRFSNASSNVSNKSHPREQRWRTGVSVYSPYRIFGEASYNFVGGGEHNFNSSVKDFIQTNFGLRFAF
jgi:hypothetical protein